MQSDEQKNNKNKTNILDFQQRIRTYKILQTLLNNEIINTDYSHSITMSIKGLCQ